MTFPLLKQLIPTGSVTGATTAQNTFALDTANDRCFIVSSGSGAANGIAALQVSTGQPIKSATSAEIGANVSLLNPICLLYSGNLFTVAAEWFNSASGWFLLLSPNNFDTLGQMNATNPGGSAPSLPLHPLISTQLVPASVGGWDFVAAPGGAIPSYGTSILQAQSNSVQFAGHNFVVDEAIPFCCRTAAGLGTIFTLGFTSGAHPVGLYKTVITNAALEYQLSLWPTTPNPGITTTKLGTIAPSAVDATWTQFDSISSACYDQTDDNLLMVVGNSAGATRYYLIKVNAITCAVMWATAVSQPPSNDFTGLDGSVVMDGVFGYVTDTHATLFDTVSGVITSQVGYGSSSFDPQFSIWDAVTQSCYGSGEFAAGTTPPYLFPGTGSWSGDQWWQIQLAAAPDYPLPIPGAPGSALSVNKAWAYVQDGHTFYVLDLGTQGTWAFDSVTNQWNELQTNGGNLAILNGIMWGQRVVGGDPASTDVWELDPGATADSGGLYEIEHIVTGGISTRSRVNIACDSLRLTASFGQIQATGATLNLRFSDDQEQSWSPYISITLTPGAYDAELAWRSLGSFAAPGRIFEISDTGGLIRIDGADAFLNGFDNDTNDQTEGAAP